jgi:hypothetical protein
MSSEKYDAYGEALPDASEGRREAATASVLLSRIGQVVFWLLVIAIVAARIIYYPASPGFDAGNAPHLPLAVAR